VVQTKREIKSGVSTHLLISNRLLIKSFNVPTREALRFLIVNDTKVVLPYDRALLWEWDSRPVLTCASGQIGVNERSALSKQIEKLVADIKEPDKPQVINKDSFNTQSDAWEKFVGDTKKTIFWFPLQDVKPRVGVWLESWNISTEEYYEKNNDALEIVSSCLFPGYTSAWEKFGVAWRPWRQRINKKSLLWLGSLLLLTGLVIQIPLRVVAPCEVVPRNPIVVKAPLDGVIDSIVVKPGQLVKADELLALYDKEIPDQEYKAAQKEVEIAQEELNRSMTLGLQDTLSQTEISVLTLKLEKAKIRFQQAVYQKGRLDIQAPFGGVVILQSPEEWRGKPVKVGEKILTISEPNDTIVRIWIPESDNIPLNLEEPVRVYLNIEPEVTHLARINYIANESLIAESQIPSFIAEAKWEDEKNQARLGLKGTAVLYGEKVSLLYFIMRKPLSSFRKLTGL
jgi:hypothetical protein